MLEREATHIEVARHRVHGIASGIGGVFLLLGMPGFVPGFTNRYDQMAWYVPHSGALLLGVFAVSMPDHYDAATERY